MSVLPKSKAVGGFSSVSTVSGTDVADSEAVAAADRS